MLALLKPRAKRLTEYVDGLRPFLADPQDYDAEAVAKHLGIQHAGADRGARATCSHTRRSTKRLWSRTCDSWPTNEESRQGALIHAERIAMTGRMVSPGLFEMLVLLGRDRVLARLQALNRWLEQSPRPAGS